MAKPTQTDLINRLGMLKTERSSWMWRWKQCSNFILPVNGRFFLEDRNKGRDRFNDIFDSTGTSALRTLGAGLMSGATSPARPWFRLQTPDPSLNAYQPVRVWLDDVSQRMHTVYQTSNTYRSLHQMYEELGVFGTSAALIMPSFNNVVWNTTLTAGEYLIATDWQGNVCTLYREFQMQVSQIVKEFGLEKCSQAIKGNYASGNLDAWYTIVHAIEPRQDRDPSKRDAKNMEWGSYYFEYGNQSQYLREGGYKRFPAVAPRWAVAGGDVYGTSPGMEALGDIKQLQFSQKRKWKAIDLQTDPPLSVPASMKNLAIDRLPGGVSYRPDNSKEDAVRPIYEVQLEMQYLLQDIATTQQRINKVFFADLFLMISQEGDPRMTATEVAARQEEKMLMLGPVYERLSNELYKPLIDITFDSMVEGNALPPPPQEMQGQMLQVVYESVLAQAQRAIRTNAVDRFTQNLGVIAQFKPDVLDKFDQDAWTDSYSDMLGVDPTMIIGNDKVAIVRDQRAKAQAAQQQAAVMEQQSKTAKNLGQTPTGTGTAYDALNSLTGYGQPVQ